MLVVKLPNADTERVIEHYIVTTKVALFMAATAKQPTLEEKI